MIRALITEKWRWFALPLAVAAVLSALLYWLGNRSGDSAAEAMAAGKYRLAGERFEAEAHRGDPAAQNSLGNLYYLGLGVNQDFERAAELYFAAARQGQAAAQLNLGNLYKQGLGVGSDPMRAFAWYKMADMHGNPMAEYYLTQLAIEFTLSPLQIEAVARKWPRLDLLVAEGL